MCFMYKHNTHFCVSPQRGSVQLAAPVDLNVVGQFHPPALLQLVARIPVCLRQSPGAVQGARPLRLRPILQSDGVVVIDSVLARGRAAVTEYTSVHDEQRDCNRSVNSVSSRLNT